MMSSWYPCPLAGAPGVLHIPDASRTVMPNGLSVVCIRKSGMPLATFHLVSRSGAGHDPDAMAGLGDACAALLTAGTSRLTAKQFAEQVESLGGEMAGSVSRDHSVLAAEVLSWNQRGMLALLFEAICDAQYPDDEVSLYCENALQTLSINRSQPAFLASEAIAAALYGTHPYSRVAPDEGFLETAERDTLLPARSERWRPDRCVLVAVGDIDPEGLLNDLAALSGGWQAGATDPFLVPPVTEPARRQVIVVNRPGSVQVNLAIGMLAPEAAHPDALALDVLNCVLGGRTGSRLFLNVRERLGYAYSVGSRYSSNLNMASWMMSAQTRTDAAADAAREMLDESERLRTGGVTDAEVAAAKSYMDGVFCMKLGTQSGLAALLEGIEVFGLAQDRIHTYRDRLRTVDTDEIQRVASRWLKPADMAVVAVGDAEALAGAMSQFGQVSVVEPGSA